VTLFCIVTGLGEGKAFVGSHAPPTAVVGGIRKGNQLKLLQCTRKNPTYRHGCSFSQKLVCWI